ncbi:MAG: four helix bundle protein [Cytophagales bacterium]|jgi:four helix bundle protein|nr:four helix bundle protein [Cytophagales bacterium]MCA6366266.1 four helix bundle protein [Cytophagales bacterium]MCA6371949.1 four helix bundle protein [Cytophagales bacterium]MCA6376657.1 four helix bundle protein [Cytophagales bacterium]MCA6383697.1 four helix bundle protein [Cytophagales bacterium]
MNEPNQSFRDLTVYKKAFDLAMKIFEMTKTFPKEERYSLTDQIRRSSRAVCSCVAEAYRKRSYKAYFVSKSSDADMENSETQSWLDFSYACNYVADEMYKDLLARSEEVGRMLNHIVENPEKYLRREKKVGMQ